MSEYWGKHYKNKKVRSHPDLNQLSSASKSDALSIGPRGRASVVACLCQIYSTLATDHLLAKIDDFKTVLDQWACSRV